MKKSHIADSSFRNFLLFRYIIRVLTKIIEHDITLSLTTVYISVIFDGSRTVYVFGCTYVYTCGVPTILNVNT